MKESLKERLRNVALYISLAGFVIVPAIYGASLLKYELIKADKRLRIPSYKNKINMGPHYDIKGFDYDKDGSLDRILVHITLVHANIAPPIDIVKELIPKNKEFSRFEDMLTKNKF